MSLFIASLNSGSNANCYYVGNAQEAVLIDAGLSCRETVRRIKNLGLDIQKVKAVFISHEHTDHISGVETLHKTFQLPVYITPRTLRNSNLELQPDLVYSFSDSIPLEIGALTILPFSKSHDAFDPHSFIVSGNGIHIGVITDLGYACQQTVHYFKQCQAVFLESNYCEDMLANGDYPLHLKRRIRGNKGHLSNNQALEIFLKYKSDQLELLILSHLSQNNNTPQLVKDLFTDNAGVVKIVVAGRDQETEVFEIATGKKISELIVNKIVKQYHEQLSLF